MEILFYTFTDQQKIIVNLFYDDYQIITPVQEFDVALQGQIERQQQKQIVSQQQLLNNQFVMTSVISRNQALEQIFQVSLSTDQARVIAKKLPSGFSVIPSRQSKRDVKRVSQDISSEDEIKIQKKPAVAQQKIDNNDEIKRCITLLQKLKKHASAAPFCRKIENVNYPEQLEYVDFQIIETNLKNNIYQTANQFCGDIKKIWQMSYTMNQKGSYLYAMTQELEQHFNDIYKEIDKPYSVKSIKDAPLKNDKQIKPSSQQIYKKPSQTSNSSIRSKPQALNKMDQPMNMQEKRVLVQNINNLPAEHLRGVWEIVSDGLKIQDQNEEFEFDIDTLPVKKTRQLEKYVNTKLEYLKKLQNKKSSDIKPTEKTDQIVDKANTTYTYAPQPVPPQAMHDSEDSSFSSDADDSI